jgi:hypothetical protein
MPQDDWTALIYILLGPSHFVPKVTFLLLLFVIRLLPVCAEKSHSNTQSSWASSTLWGVTFDDPSSSFVILEM